MGNAIYCDRCNKLFNTAEIDVRHGKLADFWGEDIEVDLCPECLSGLDDYVHGEDLNKHPKKRQK